MADQPEQTSIQARIAALNLNQVGRTPSDPPPSYQAAVAGKRRPPPPLPKRAPRPTATSPRVAPSIEFDAHDTAEEDDGAAARPALPPRRPSPASSTAVSEAGTPKLPPRRPSTNTIASSNGVGAGNRLGRRSSRESVLSIASTASTASRPPPLRVPEFDRESLPPLPVRRRSAAAEEQTPPLPGRRPNGALTNGASNGVEAPPPIPGRRPNGYSSGLSNGHSNGVEKPPPLPGRRPNAVEESAPQLPGRPPRPGAGAAPPVPMGSRPNLAALQASKPKPNAPPVSCLLCRDFTAPDEHASRFPKDSIPYMDPAWLGRELTAPFDSLTDKARAIFTWLHYNIDYDVVGFHNLGNTPRKYAADTMRTGLAVCQGYAELFESMATAAGLEVIVVGGHGKGAGYDYKGGPLPPFKPDGHAWNAVKIDHGQWKLLDACWGAGHVKDGVTSYVRAFNPKMFTASNEDFGIRHFPKDPSHWFRADGRALGWDEYILLDADRPTTYHEWESELGLRRLDLVPAHKDIRVSGPREQLPPTERVSFTRVCPHWRNSRAAQRGEYVLLLLVPGLKNTGYLQDLLTVETDGYNYWVDVPRRELGAPGETLQLVYLSQVEGRDARGTTTVQWEREIKGKKGVNYSILAEWNLV